MKYASSERKGEKVREYLKIFGCILNLKEIRVRSSKIY